LAPQSEDRRLHKRLVDFWQKKFGKQPPIPEPPVVERRMVPRLVRYWLEKCGDRDLPCLEDIRPEEIGDLWEKCCILDVVKSPDSPYFHYLGAALAKFSGVLLSGESDWTQTLLDHVVRNFVEVLDKRTPVIGEEDLLRFDGSRVLFRSVLLPLSEDQKTINYILGAASAKIVKE